MAKSRVPADVKARLPAEVVRLPAALLRDLRALIAETRREVARTVNSALVTLYWNVGRRIRQDVLKHKRAEYGKRILPALSRQLAAEFGSGFKERNLA